MRVLGLVTARGGSKGFPGKNLALLAGRPLVAWSHRLLAGLRQAHPEAELELRLSTDDPAIAAVWPEPDRPRELRPAHLSTDEATSLAVVEYELELIARAGQPCGAVLLLQPTSPLLAVGDLEAAWQMFAPGCPSVAGAAAADHPVQWSFYRREDGLTEPVVPRMSDDPRQRLRGAYWPAGFWLVSTEFLRKHRGFFVSGVTRTTVVPPERYADIDKPIDLESARCRLAETRTDRVMDISGRRIGGGTPAFVIAEAGVNHNGQVELARKLVEAAAEAGASAVKFQTFQPGDLVTRSAAKASYQVAQTGAGESQYDMLARLVLPEASLRELKAYAEKLSLVFLSSPFDLHSARLLQELGVAAFKLGSGELTNHPFLIELAKFGKPLILSTGMASLDEVEDAAAVLRAHGDPPVAWLHCVSSYPAPAEQSNLRALESLRLAVGGPVGMSDHSLGWEVTLAAVALGAQIIEKHLTLSRTLEGPDHAASLEPHEFKAMMEQIRRVEAALGNGVKAPAACELDAREVARKSLVAARDLPAGTRLTAADIAIKRPGTGFPPSDLNAVIGQVLNRPLQADELLNKGHFSGQ